MLHLAGAGVALHAKPVVSSQVKIRIDHSDLTRPPLYPGLSQDGFRSMIILETDRLRIRNWQESDRPLFAEINADPKVMEFFSTPSRRPRGTSPMR